MGVSTVSLDHALPNLPSIEIQRALAEIKSPFFPFSSGDLVGRFIYSVTYSLSCFVCRTVELVQHSIEIPSGEAPLERFGNTLVMPLESE
jgi:hypothetical protein